VNGPTTIPLVGPTAAKATEEGFSSDMAWTTAPLVATRVSCRSPPLCCWMEA